MKYYISLFVILVIASCGKKAEAPLNKEDFTHLLIDIHLTDAIIGVEGYRMSREEGQKEKYYNFLYKKYGITPAEFDSCVVIYSNNLVEYEVIYQDVVDSLNHLKSGYDIELAEKHKRDTTNLWTSEKKYSFPADSANIVECEIPFNDIGMYSLSMRVKMRKGDKGINNRITGYFIKKSIAGQDSIIPFDTIKLRTDTVWRYYNIHKFAEDTTYTGLHFKILDCDNVDSLKNRKAEIKAIKLVNPMFEGPMPSFDEFPRR